MAVTEIEPISKFAIRQGSPIVEEYPICEKKSVGKTYIIRKQMTASQDRPVYCYLVTHPAEANCI